MLLAGLTTAFVDSVATNPALPPEVQSTVSTKASESGLEVITVDQAEQFALDAGLPPDQAAALASDYGDALLEGLQSALAAVAVFALLGLWFTRHLPSSMGGQEVPATDEPEAAADATA
jgi:hypothetical protein